jgi:hypothetical protein
VTRKSIPHVHYANYASPHEIAVYALPAYRRCIGPAGSIDLTETAHRMSGLGRQRRTLAIGGDEVTDQGATSI